MTRGAIYCDHLHQYDKAIEDFSRAIALDPKNPDAHGNLGHSLQGKGQLDEAIAAYSRAIERDPKDLSFWHGRGLAYSSLGQYEKALAEYQTILELAPADALAHHQLAWLLATCPDVKLRDPSRAVELARKAVQLAPQEANHWTTLGTAHYRAGDWKAAVAALDKSRELDKAPAALTWLFLAMTHRKLGHDGEARQAYDKALRWLEQNKETLAQHKPQLEALRRIQSEAEAVLELKKP
jgi:tetratricopeptide (TPR) repeat protein